MVAEFEIAFARLKAVLGRYSRRLCVKVDVPTEYTVVTKSPSPFPQHKGQPMFFGAVRLGKAYVSFHLMPLYMDPVLAKAISPGLKKRMQGKTCFNFKTGPDQGLIADLAQLTQASFERWERKKWL